MKNPHTLRSRFRHVRPETPAERASRRRDQLDVQMVIYSHYCRQAMVHPDPDVRIEMLLAVDSHVNVGHVPHEGPPKRLIGA